jgi:hypothetical protein
MHFVNSPAEVDALGDVVRKRLAEQRVVSVRGADMSEQQSADVRARLIDRFVDDVLARLRAVLGNRTASDADRTGETESVVATVAGGDLSNRFTSLIKEELGQVVGPSAPRQIRHAADAELSEPESGAAEFPPPLAPPNGNGGGGDGGDGGGGGGGAPPGGGATVGITPSGITNVCATAPPGGTELSLFDPPPWKPGVDLSGWQGPRPGVDDWDITVFLDDAPFNIAHLLLESGGPMGLSRDQILLGLANETDWEKEIWTWNRCDGRALGVRRAGQIQAPQSIILNRRQGRETSTLVFRKPGFLGEWQDIGHFAPGDPFWNNFGQTIATFTWIVD